MKTLAFALLLLAVPALAQRLMPRTVRPKGMVTAYTSVQWTWTPPTTGAAPAGYNLYQAPSACPSTGLPTGAVMIADGDTLTSFVQTPLPATMTCTYVTAVSAVGVEGPPSPTFQLDTSAPGAPGAPKPTLQ